MDEIQNKAELYAETFRLKVDDAGWYDQKVRDYIAGYNAALNIARVIIVY